MTDRLKELLDASKNAEPRASGKKHDPEMMLALALAFADRRVTAAEVCEALGWRHSANVYNAMGSVLMRAVRAGQITLVNK
jgi:hypothetical protein